MSADEPVSNLKARLLINITHQGETTSVSKNEFMDAIRDCVVDLFEKEDDVEIESSGVVVMEFSYSDNVEQLRSDARAMVDAMDFEDLLEFMKENNK